MARVAKKNKNKYQNQADKKLAELKGNYGYGVCVLVRIYNATGGTLEVKETASFRGRIGDQAIEDSIPNGTWTVFIHTKRDAAAAGSAGAVILQNADGIEFFAGWQNPWRRGDSQVFVEIKEPGYWWAKKSQDTMLAILDDHNGQKHKHTSNGFSMFGSTGNETTAYVEFLCEIAPPLSETA
ncbi:hypothetical protein FB451DRAFT_1417321 [Mycena latifolia]|nr:hypothetical protein FB451DRAFT_1417321 [Mycena latifolia]